LRSIYLSPLDSDPDGGEAARETLNAYFASGRHVSSAAAKLGVKRHTVTRRLRAVEKRLGRTLSTCSTEMEVAIKLERLEALRHP
jgi:DNA-binding PucR family transcriptional regulator